VAQMIKQFTFDYPDNKTQPGFCSKFS
jgi:hypothetical protein